MKAPDQRMNTGFTHDSLGIRFIQSIRKIALLKHTKENIVIEMKVLSCLDSGEQPFTLKFNLLSSLLGVKAKREANIIFSFL